MKRFLLFAALCAILSSCAPSRYFQMYQTAPISDIRVESNRMVFEDDNCQILYNFWREEGEIGFVFVNKTNENIYLHLDECFYVANGVAYDYYKNRVFTNSRSYTASAHLSNLYTTTIRNADVLIIANPPFNSVSTVEKPIVCIPPQTSRIITEYDIKTSLYRSCDLLRYPSKKDPHSVTFTRDDSPLTFGNRIAYSVGDNEALVRVNNDFYVSKISNYRAQEITKTEHKTECGEKVNGKLIHVFKESGPDQFFISYTATTTMLTH